MELSQHESSAHRARTTPLAVYGGAQNVVNNEKSDEVVATPHQPQHKEERRLSTGERKAEEREASRSPIAKRHPEHPEERRSSIAERKKEEHKEEKRASIAEQKEEEQRSVTMEDASVEEAEEDAAMAEVKGAEERERKRPREEETEEDEKISEEKVEAKRAKTTPTVSAVEEGRGVRLEDIPNFVANYHAIKSNSTSLRKLYKALFHTAGKPQTRRSEILQWKGIAIDASTEDLFTALSTACTAAEVAEIGKKYLGLSTGVGGKTTKQAWCEAITEILADPQPDKILLTPSADTSKRFVVKSGAGGYQAWCRDHKDELKAKYPDVSHKEFLKIQSEAWKRLSEEERGKYLGPPSARTASPKKKGKSRKAHDKEEEDQEGEEELQKESHGEEDEDQAAATEEQQRADVSSAE